MSTRIALVEHSRPRILAIDFAQSDVRKVSDLGFNVRLGATGVHPPSKCCIPWAVQDVEVVFATVSPGSFSKAGERPLCKDSVEDGPHFQALMREVWDKAGWAVLFIQQECPPLEVLCLGITSLGVMVSDRQFIPITYYLQHRKGFDSRGIKVRGPMFPRFDGESAVIDSDEAVIGVLQRYIRNAEMSVLSVSKDDHLAWTDYRTITFLVTDESAVRSALAIKLSWVGKGRVLLLPDFGKNNIDAAIAILQEVIAEDGRHLFDSPEHSWLTEYVPYPVQVVRQESRRVVEEAQAELGRLSESEKQLLGEFNWMLGLLTSPGDEFRDHAAEALKFLGFEVDIVDNNVPPGQPLREDLHIIDRGAGLFLLGETKSTKRGASEGFITDVQNHQGRFSREHQQPIPDALLLVNHSTGLDPAQRPGRFYTAAHIESRCQSNGILAIDSVALYSMCQSILRGEAEPAQIREYIRRIRGVLRGFAASSLAAPPLSA
jgi:hypothetical protein